MKSYTLILLITFILMFVINSLASQEEVVIRRVAREYNLSAEETRLLLAIRKFENGRTGLEFGVGQDYPRHRARRYPKDPLRSLELQARWAAGTIKKRYTGDLRAFARIYCPHAPLTWENGVRRIMKGIR